MGRPSDTELSEPPVLRTWNIKYTQLYNVQAVSVSLFLENPWGRTQNNWVCERDCERVTRTASEDVTCGSRLCIISRLHTRDCSYVLGSSLRSSPRIFGQTRDYSQSASLWEAHDGLMASAHASRSSGLSSCTGFKHCAVFLGQDTLLSKCLSQPTCMNASAVKNLHCEWYLKTISKIVRAFRLLK